MSNVIKIAIIGLGQVGNYLYRELNLQRRNIEIKPEEDYLIFWNGILPNDKYHYNTHCVPPQECEHGRVMIAGNID